MVFTAIAWLWVIIGVWTGVMVVRELGKVPDYVDEVEEIEKQSDTAEESFKEFFKKVDEYAKNAEELGEMTGPDLFPWSIVICAVVAWPYM